jgi:hypothetical protein
VELAATIRPDDWNVALFLHVLGAMVAVGGLTLALVYLAAAWRGRAPESLRAGFRSLLYGAIPGYVVMRGAAQWIYVEEHLDELETDPAWIEIGFAVTDAGLLLLIIATIVSGISSRRRPAGVGAETPDDLGGTGGIRVSAVLVGVLLIAYLITLWAMTAKPV